MTRLSARRLEKVFEFLQQAYRAQDLDEFANTVPSALTRVIEADITTYSEVNPARKRVGWHHQPKDAPLPKLRTTFEQLMHGDPLVSWYAKGSDGRVATISDLMTRSTFHSLPIYNEFYRHLRVEYQIAFLLDTPRPQFVGVTLNRAAMDFTQEDRLTLNLLRPHLIQAYRNAEVVTESRREIALMTQGFDEAGRGIILVSAERVIVKATMKARRYLASYFRWPAPGSSDSLPGAIDAWLGEQMKRRSDTALVALPAMPFSVENGDGKLAVRLVIQDDQILLLLDEHSPWSAEDPSLLRVLQSLGLSPRESEVLSWVVAGKTNPEIATILGLSRRTVQTHLDHIYRKLDVTTRAAAVAKAMGARALAPPVM